MVSIPNNTELPHRKRVAVIGGGISGLGAAWLLSHYSPHQVTLIEENAQLGGHANTVDCHPNPAPVKPVVADSLPSALPVDTGFIVYNDFTYPNLARFFRHLEVETVASDMSFSVSQNRGAFEWAGTSLGSLFAQWSNVWSLSFWWMLYDIIRFNCLAPTLLSAANKEPALLDLTLGEYLHIHRYSDAFQNRYLLPMVSSIWSMPMEGCALAFPVVTLVRFMSNHGLLNIVHRPVWRTVRHGSRVYVNKVAAMLPEIQRNRKIVQVRRWLDLPPSQCGNGKVNLRSPIYSKQSCGVVITDDQGYADYFDYVIFATHADQTLEILGEDATPTEREILESFRFTRNRIVLHSDVSLMPRRRKVWASWNYLMHSPKRVALTYWMNKLQALDEQRYGPVLVTLNPPWEPDPTLCYGQWNYFHPQMTPTATAAQRKLARYQTSAASKSDHEGISEGFHSTRTLFCGAWTNYGFHEDGLTSGLRAALLLGAHCPFPITYNDSHQLEDIQLVSPWVIRFFALMNWISRMHLRLIVIACTVYICYRRATNE
ncbi:hypothetical protein IWQ62_002473 [Dispira parvispora]|uniref:Amine oxidase domain-containing protein n=1 Tax=Dispira parvispora TaxID=1520584 RepID=A0A9W8E3T6_9FUNG|nr:hypothetical protein IWQ62_002473 [Dispira parvispora]